MSIDLKGKVALITGSARGLGLLVAQDLAREGMNIAGTDFRGDQLIGAMGEIENDFGVETLAVAADVANEEEVVSLVAQVVAKWGRIDVLVNNAGIRQIAPVWETDSAMWNRLHTANLRGQFLCTREVLKQDMRERNEGTIICVSSGSGKEGRGRRLCLLRHQVGDYWIR